MGPQGSPLAASSMSTSTSSIVASTASGATTSTLPVKFEANNLSARGNRLKRTYAMLGMSLDITPTDH